MKTLLPLIGFAISMVGFVHSAAAWDGQVTGRLAMISVSPKGTVYVRLEGLPDLCSSTGSSSFYSKKSSVMAAGVNNATSEGIERTLKTLLAAKLAGKPVEVSSLNSSEWGCILGEVRLIE